MILHSSTCICAFTYISQFYFVDIAGQVENISNTTNCSHTVVCWEHPQPKELPISYYSYQLTSNDTLVENNVTTNFCVTIDVTVMEPNMFGFNFTIEAHAPPWNGTEVSIQLIAATGMYSVIISYFSPGRRHYNRARPNACTMCNIQYNYI